MDAWSDDNSGRGMHTSGVVMMNETSQGYHRDKADFTGSSPVESSLGLTRYLSLPLFQLRWCYQGHWLSYC
jgi:hypothetical protein